MTCNCQECTCDKPKDAKEIIENLLKGIIAWANDENGIHDECYDAFVEAAKFINKPEFIDDDYEIKKLTEKTFNSLESLGECLDNYDKNKNEETLLAIDNVINQCNILKKNLI